MLVITKTSMETIPKQRYHRFGVTSVINTMSVPVRRKRRKRWGRGEKGVRGGYDRGASATL